MLESEMQQTRDWVRSHVSDCSGFHYRQYLLRRVGSVPLLSRELSLCEELCLLHPGHEAIWAHRRFCSGTCTRCPPATGWARPRPRGPATPPAATGLPGTRRPSSPVQRGAASGRMRWLHATRGGCAMCSGGRRAARRDSPQSCPRSWFRRVVDVAKKSVGKEW
ncbi:hypothetical protein IscW_ISCW011038 [Ixodes scapularis]|uniref:Uncharacterized protein n=1 Tax=Ixodes scapularis TaxID=6945 RepID=B7Q4Y2_IXOSC|nr:hypothetical protein IscW_ISCW011038 [Ixodes scapularis]|eukprot:XP_002401196.1 hypothetical protein IscW_ISCW011038 [Ixodes scapularis]